MGFRQCALEGMVKMLNFYMGKKVLVTGHTGFKGAWMCRALLDAGAEVAGYALKPPTQPNLFGILGLSKQMNSIIGDIRDLDGLMAVFEKVQPEIVIHMAAQPLVRDSYEMPRYTYETNVMGTVNVLECVRRFHCVKSFLNVTTDKVYKNYEWEWGYREDELLDGFDPYSNSKSCSELVTHSYKNSFFADGRTAISTARAGNVIGGGDFAKDRIIPDCVRAALKREPVIVRNPHSTRPYQHALEPIFAYLLIAQKQYVDGKYSGYYNIGPDDTDLVDTGELVELFCEAWGAGQSWENHWAGGPHEATFLKLDCSRFKSVFEWKPRWPIGTAVEKTVEWTKAWAAGDDISLITSAQIKSFLEDGTDV